MPVCGIVKTAARGAVDSSVHFCPRLAAEVNSTSSCPQYEGSSFDYSNKTAMK